jgi:hypothetical protein
MIELFGIAMEMENERAKQASAGFSRGQRAPARLSFTPDDAESARKDEECNTPPQLDAM